MAAKGTRHLSTRLAIEGDEEARKKLERFGAQGQAALKRLEAQGKPTSSALLAIDKASRGAGQGLGVLGETARSVGGPVGALSGRLSGLVGTLGRVPAPAAALAAVVGGLSVAFRGAAQAGEALELRQRRLGALIKATGGAAGLTAAGIEGMSERITEAVGGTEKEIEDAAAVLLTFRSIAGQTFERTILVAKDLSAVFETGLRSSIVQLGKALEDPVRGLSALREVGVSFTDAQKEMVDQLIATGDKAGAVNLILGELERQVGGAAAAEGEGLTGATSALAREWTNLLEGIDRTFSVSEKAAAGFNLLARGVAAVGRGIDPTLEERLTALRDEIAAEQAAIIEIGARPPAPPLPSGGGGQSFGMDPAAMLARGGPDERRAAEERVAALREELSLLEEQQRLREIGERIARRTSLEVQAAAEAERKASQATERQEALDKVVAALEREAFLATATREERGRLLAVEKAVAAVKGELTEDEETAVLAAQAKVAAAQALVEAEKEGAAARKEATKAATKAAQDELKAREKASKAAQKIIKQDEERAKRLEDFIVSLETEAKLAALTTEERDLQLKLMRAQKIASRALTEEESKRIEAAEEARQAAEEVGFDFKQSFADAFQDLSRSSLEFFEAFKEGSADAAERLRVLLQDAITAAAGTAGAAIGAYFGGPAGAKLGQTIGEFVGEILGSFLPEFGNPPTVGPGQAASLVVDPETGFLRVAGPSVADGGSLERALSDAQTVADILNQTIEALGGKFTGDVVGQVGTLKGNEDTGEIGQFVIRPEDLLLDNAFTQVASLEEAAAVLLGALAEAGQIAGLSQEELAALVAGGQVAAFDVSLRAATLAIDEYSAELRAAEIEAQRTADSFGRLADSLEATIQSLRLSSLSPLSPAERLAEAKGLFDETLAAALGGDEAALGELGPLGRELLSLSRDVNATSEDFAADFALVEAGLADAQAVSQDIADLALTEVDLLRAQQDELEAIRTTLAGGQALERELLQAQIDQAATLPEEIADALAAVLAGHAAIGGSIGGAPGGGNTIPLGAPGSEFVTWGQGGFLVRRDELGPEFHDVDFRTFASAVPPFYGHGGRFPAGRDLLLGERGAEVVRFDRPGRIIANDRITVSDGGEMVRALEMHGRATLLALGTIDQQIAEQTRALRGTLAILRRTVELAA